MLYISISRHIMAQHLINMPPEIKSECIQISTPHNKFIENTKDISVFDISATNDHRLGQQGLKYGDIQMLPLLHLFTGQLP